MGAWRTLHPRRILHAPGAISIDMAMFRQANVESGSSGLELECSAGRATATPKQQTIHKLI